MKEYNGRINLLKDEMLFITNDVFDENIKSSETKENILKKISKMYEDADEKDIIKLLPYDSYKVLDELREYVKNSSDIEKFTKRKEYIEIRYLERAMILVLRVKGNKYTYSLNEGVLEKLDNIFSRDNRVLAQRYGKMEKLIIGMLYSYGVIEFKEFRKKLCKYMNEYIDNNEIDDLCFKRLTLNPFVNYENILWKNTGVRQEFLTYLYSEYFDDIIENIIKEQDSRGLKYKEFTIDEILKREEYIWDKQTQEIYDIIYLKNKRFYPMSLKKMAKSIELGLNIGNNIFGCCSFESLDEANDFLQIYMNWRNSRSQYILGGYSPIEFKEKFYKR